jgi:hypothetical protein
MNKRDHFDLTPVFNFSECKITACNHIVAVAGGKLVGHIAVAEVGRSTYYQLSVVGGVLEPSVALGTQLPYPAGPNHNCSIQLVHISGINDYLDNERSAITRAKTIGTAITLEIVLLTHFSTLHHLKYPLASQMHQAVVCAAIHVAEAVGIHGGFLMETMVDLSIDNAWAACLKIMVRIEVEFGAHIRYLLHQASMPISC